MRKSVCENESVCEAVVCVCERESVCEEKCV